ncbi:MAG TPA: hypothetical protein VFU69_11550 [Ktedonobacterales bacterium]|nr:hypothetical protein [Ktedonobacterales bacterium]
MPIADIPEPGWLQAVGQAAGVVLIIELLMLILIMAALVLALALGLLYVHNKVVPILTRFAPAIEQRLQATDRGSAKFAERVIDIHARTVAVKEGMRALIRPNGHRELPPDQDGRPAQLEGYRADGPRQLPGGRNGH